VEVDKTGSADKESEKGLCEKEGVQSPIHILPRKRAVDPRNGGARRRGKHGSCPASRAVADLNNRRGVKWKLKNQSGINKGLAAEQGEKTKCPSKRDLDRKKERKAMVGSRAGEKRCNREETGKGHDWV